MGRKPMSPEARAAAGERLKAARMAKATTPTTTGTTIAPASVVSYEKAPRRFVKPAGDGYHYVMVERKPTNYEIDYQGDKLADQGYEMAPPEMQRAKQFDVFRIPIEEYNARRLQRARASTAAANAPVEFQPDNGRITENTVKDSPEDTVRVEATVSPQ